MRITSLIHFAAVAAAAPQVNFPFNSQFPSIARVGQFYSFQFALTTFQPDADQLQYSLIGNPPWLYLNGGNRTLQGTPQAGDKGTVSFTITAAGTAGAVANMDSKLLVTDTDAPSTNLNVSQPLAKAGSLSGPKTLTLLPSTPFDITFPADTFTSSANLSYFATMADHTPLPSWISFDPSTLHFAGTTPPLTSSPQWYDIDLNASEDPNYTGISMAFTLVVSNHQFSFRPMTQDVNITKGSQVNFNTLRGDLFLDNAAISDADIRAATADIPSWLSFDDHSFAITGTPPSGLMSQDISVTATDRFGDNATASINFHFESKLFVGALGQINITAGEDFSYTIPSSVLSKGDQSVNVDFGSLGKWLQLDSSTLTISGKLPPDYSTGDVQATLTATTADGKSKDSQSFTIHVSEATTAIVPSPTVSAEPSATGKVAATREEDSKSRKNTIIAGVIISSIVAFVFLLACIVMVCRRRRRKEAPSSPRSPKKSDISRPILVEEEWEDIDNSLGPDLERGDVDVEEPLLERTPERPPQLNLDLASKTRNRESASSSIEEGQADILDGFNRSSWGFNDATGPSHHPSDSMKIPTAMARQDSENSIVAKRSRRKTAVYRDSCRSAVSPLTRRLSGVGHGRHTYSPSRIASFSVPRRHMSFSSYSTQTTSYMSSTPSQFPQPPTARHSTQLTTPLQQRRSIRIVSNTGDSLAERRTMDEKRNSFIKKRASAQSPFFASSRVSSSSYKTPDIDEGSRPEGATPLISNVIVRPDETPETTERQLPDILRVRKPSDATSIATTSTQNTQASKSLRKPPAPRLFLTRNKSRATTDNNGVQKPSERPTTALLRPVPGRRTSSNFSIRAGELKAEINRLTDSKIFADVDMSESEYSEEEDTIAEYPKRNTIRQAPFVRPLNFNPLRRSSKRGSKRNSKRESKTDIKSGPIIESSKGETMHESKVEPKSLATRPATSYSLMREHGGKENQSSTYSLALTNASKDKLPSTSKDKAVTTLKDKGKAKVTEPPPRSPHRPKTAKTQDRATYHASTESRPSARSSMNQQSQLISQAGQRPLSSQPSQASRHSQHSQKSSRSHHSNSHSRNHSKRSVSHNREHSRTQSSAYPYFEAPVHALSPTDPNSSHKRSSGLGTGKENTYTRRPSRLSAQRNYSFPHPTSGNFTTYGISEQPSIEELSSGSLALRAENGSLTAGARNSKLVKLSKTQSQSEHPLVQSQSRQSLVSRPSTTRSVSTPISTTSQTGNRKSGSRVSGSQTKPPSLRYTAITPKTPIHTPQPSANLNIGAGLGLSGLALLGQGADETPDGEHIAMTDRKSLHKHQQSRRGRTRSPLSVQDANSGSPERLTVMEGKGKRPISVEAGEDASGSGKRGRSTWGSLRAVWGGSVGKNRGRVGSIKKRESDIKGNEAFL